MPKTPDPPNLLPFPPDPSLHRVYSAQSWTCRAREAEYGDGRYGVSAGLVIAFSLSTTRSAFSCPLRGRLLRSTRSLRSLEALFSSLWAWPLRSMSVHCINYSGQSSLFACPTSARLYPCLVPFDGMLWSGGLFVSVIFVRSAALFVARLDFTQRVFMTLLPTMLLSVLLTLDLPLAGMVSVCLIVWLCLLVFAQCYNPISHDFAS